jgi:hypothetical protein
MGDMKRLFTVCAGGLALGAGLFAGSASAKVVELGATRTPLAAPPPCTSKSLGNGTCPGGMTPNTYTILQTRVTALATLSDGVAYPTTAHQPGRIVAFTVGLSALDTNRSVRKQEIQNEDLNYGGTTRIQIAVLRRVGARKRMKWKVVASSPASHVQPYLGEVVQIPLENTLPVRAGDVVALTTPTWAPVLLLSQNTKKFAYRQSRKANCASPPNSNQAQVNTGQTAPYGCDYPGTRVEYSVTEVTTAPYPKHYVHAPDTAVAAFGAAPSAMPLVTGGAGL